MTAAGRDAPAIETMLSEMNLRTVRADAAMAATCRLRALALVDDPAASDATREAAARFLWSETDMARHWARHLLIVDDPASAAEAVAAAEWCARRACCDLHRRAVLQRLDRRGLFRGTGPGAA